jgi:hypothetical protein
MRIAAFCAICGLILLASALPASATMTIWQNACSEDQVNNSGIGEGLDKDSCSFSVSAPRSF